MTKTQLLLITGFLGAGKTTFLRGFLKRFSDKRLYVIVNEFGKAGVDGLLLNGLGADVHEIIGGSVFCSCKIDQFEQTLKIALSYQPDMIVVEASGLSDPSAIRQITDQYAELTYTGCIALADAANVSKVLGTSRMAAKQLAVAGMILLNKTDLVSPAEADAAAAMLRERFPQAEVRPTRQGAFESAWLNSLQPAAPASAGAHERDLTLQKACVVVSGEMTSTQLAQFLKLFAEDTYRTKGLLQLADGAFQVDGIGAAVQVLRYAGPLPAEANRIAALAGAGMALHASIEKARQWYPDLVLDVE